MSELFRTNTLREILFVLEDVACLSELAKLPAFQEVTSDLATAIVDESIKWSKQVLEPTNLQGDKQGARLNDSGVYMPESFKQAYASYVEASWGSLAFPTEYGGQGLPHVLAFAVAEIMHSANTSFSLCPMLNQGTVELLYAHGCEEQKRNYLPKLITGEWTGTMNLTEPQSGSDLSTVQTRAELDPSLGNNTYRLKGQKIYITYGDHDLSENIIHMVLARTPDAPAGTKGISLFLAPKFLFDDAGQATVPNDIRCISLEHKLGIHASPTCTMSFGENQGAIAYLVGELGAGLKQMFTMMNNARLSVGLQGVALSARALELAAQYASDRVQGVALGFEERGPIWRHPDVFRTLLEMKARAEAGRALTYWVVAALDRSGKSPDEKVRKEAQQYVDLFTPVVKAWCSDNGVADASAGIQIHGGMGYVEESGAPQLLRDARIAPIYEGTNGIQAADLVFRKVGRDDGEAAIQFTKMVRTFCQALGDIESLQNVKTRLEDGLKDFENATDWVVKQAKIKSPQLAFGSRVYLEILGRLAGGYLLALQAYKVLSRGPSAQSDEFYISKIILARFYADHFLPFTASLTTSLLNGYMPTITENPCLEAKNSLS